jgi:hypothetical protein
MFNKSLIKIVAMIGGFILMISGIALSIVGVSRVGSGLLIIPTSAMGIMGYLTLKYGLSNE